MSNYYHCLTDKLHGQRDAESSLLLLANIDWNPIGTEKELIYTINQESKEPPRVTNDRASTIAVQTTKSEEATEGLIAQLLLRYCYEPCFLLTATNILQKGYARAQLA
jgi:hypothetical protein